MGQRVNNCKGDQKRLFTPIHSLFGRKTYYSVASIYQLFFFGIFNKHVFIVNINKSKLMFMLIAV